MATKKTEDETYTFTVTVPKDYNGMVLDEILDDLNRDIRFKYGNTARVENA